MQLIDKTIVITGGTSGIGLALVNQLAALNSVVVIGRNKARLAQLGASQSRVVTYSCDLADPVQVNDLILMLGQRYQSLDVLINNAAVQFTPQLTDEDFDASTMAREVQINFLSVCSLVHGLLPLLMKTPASVIMNINSGLALAPKTNSAVYCATKSALNTFSIALRYQLKNSGIKVHQAFLPLVDTHMTRGRGRNKLKAEVVASRIIDGIEKGFDDHDVGKVKLLRVMMRLLPSVAYKLMERA